MPKRRHSLDVALDRSMTLTAYAVGKDGKAFIKVHAFNYKNDDHYVVYALTPVEGEEDSYKHNDDTICGRFGLLKWIIAHTEVKTERGARGFLYRFIWEPVNEHPMLKDN